MSKLIVGWLEFIFSRSETLKPNAHTVWRGVNLAIGRTKTADDFAVAAYWIGEAILNLEKDIVKDNATPDIRTLIIFTEDSFLRGKRVCISAKGIKNTK